MLDKVCVVCRSSKRQSDEIKESNFGHDEQEWGFKDDSEVIEWDRYYNDKTRKWRLESDEA